MVVQMSCFPCFNIGRRTGVDEPHAKDTLQDTNIIGKGTAPHRAGIDAAKVIDTSRS